MKIRKTKDYDLEPTLVNLKLPLVDKVNIEGEFKPKKGIKNKYGTTKNQNKDE